MSCYCVSECLLGKPCRYNGKAKPADLRALGADAEIIPFCPECAAGLGCPREPIELVKAQNASEVRVLGVSSRTDVTERIRAACEAQLALLKKLPEPVAAFILKARSPSCGKKTPLHDSAGTEIGFAPGEWARLLQNTFPEIPIYTEEELLSL